MFLKIKQFSMEFQALSLRWNIVQADKSFENIKSVIIDGLMFISPVD